MSRCQIRVVSLYNIILLVTWSKVFVLYTCRCPRHWQASRHWPCWRVIWTQSTMGWHLRSWRWRNTSSRTSLIHWSLRRGREWNWSSIGSGWASIANNTTLRDHHIVFLYNICIRYFVYLWDTGCITINLFLTLRWNKTWCHILMMLWYCRITYICVICVTVLQLM